jgi:hypothetical protein
VVRELATRPQGRVTYLAVYEQLNLASYGISFSALCRFGRAARDGAYQEDLEPLPRTVSVPVSGDSVDAAADDLEAIAHRLRCLSSGIRGGLESAAEEAAAVTTSTSPS